MKRFVSMLFALFITLAAVAPASAAPPVTETDTWDEVYPLFDCNEVGRDFWIYDNEVGSEEYKYFTDEDGNLIKIKGHLSAIDHLFAEDYPDTVVVGNFVANWTMWWDPETGEPTLFHQAGNFWHINLPGYGNVLNLSGLINFDPSTDDWEIIKEAGIRYLDFESLCEYLDPTS